METSNIMLILLELLSMHKLFKLLLYFQFRSDNFPASYNPQTSCTNQFYSTADGITFEFQSFFTEQHFDFIVFRDSAGNDFGGQSCSGFLDVNIIVNCR